MTFTAVIEPGETSGWVGHIPALPGLWTQGETREQLADNLADAAKLWLAAQEAQALRLSRETIAIAV